MIPHVTDDKSLTKKMRWFFCLSDGYHLNIVLLLQDLESCKDPRTDLQQSI